MWSRALLVLALACAARALTRFQLYSHGLGFDRQLPRGNEVASPELSLAVPIVFYGETYPTLYVNNHGVLSFRTDIAMFINAEFPLAYPAIAAFYANVDTTAAGAVYYRETQEKHAIAKAAEAVRDNFPEYDGFQPSGVFLATWEDVGYNRAGADKLNTFQIAVISNGTESFVEFLFPEGGVQWIQGVQYASGLPDARAQSGFVAEDGRFFTLKGSGSHQIRNIASWTNTGELGQYVYRIGNIRQGENVVLPDQYDNNDAETEEFRSCSQSGPTVCHTQARCVDYQTGICCQCNDGFYGNGKSCIKTDVPLRVSGKLTGEINSITLDELDIQSYVVVIDGRTYTAVSRVPDSVGYSLQTLNILGGVIGWLFAKPLGSALNGYQLTGAVFNHTAEILFPRTGDRVIVRQQFFGHDVFDQVNLEADVRGTLPVIDPGTKVEIGDYEEQYTMTEAGAIRSDSVRVFRDRNNAVEYEMRVTQTFHFSPCRHAPVGDADRVPVTLKVGKNFLGYEGFDDREGIVRYGMSNKVVPLGQEDPCIRGRDTCGEHSSCVIDGDSFKCVCEYGYQAVYFEGGREMCVDVNECTTGTHNCDANAQCSNLVGDFRCECGAGFTGDGVTCQSIASCGSYDCDPNASCRESFAGPECVCNEGYSGDGRGCWRVEEYPVEVATPPPRTEPPPTEPPAQQAGCDVLRNCSPYATCEYSYSTRSYACQCARGYYGNGYACYPERTEPTPPVPTEPLQTPPPTLPPRQEAGCEILQDCSVYATCEYTYSTRSYACQCARGYYGNGYTCYPEQTPPTSWRPPPQQTTVASRRDDSVKAQTCGVFYCSCDSGYVEFTAENGTALCRKDQPEVEAVKEPSTDEGFACSTSEQCPQNSACVYNSMSEGNECQCHEGYASSGDGECVPEAPRGDCAACDPHAVCANDGGRGVCVCDAGYTGDGTTCRPGAGCLDDAECEANAECRLDTYSGRSECQCRAGHQKDANDACVPEGDTCNMARCVEHATCVYDPENQIDYCRCDDGYVGEGIDKCEVKRATCEVARNCHPDALCIQDEFTFVYECICRDGYTGDGYACAVVRTCLNDPSMCDRAASCVRRADGYACECNSGHSGDGRSCAADPKPAGNFLLLATGTFVLRVPFAPTYRDPVRPILNSNTQTAVGLDVDCQTGKMYWGDVTGRVINTAYFDGTGFEKFTDHEITSPEGVSVDWVSRNIFWTDSKKLTIEVANIDTKLRKVLFDRNLVNPRGIAVHPQRGKIFWSDWNRREPKIEWANMDGSERAVFVSGSGLLLPNSLAVDWASERLCFADAGVKRIECVHIDTRQRDVVATNCSYPFGLAITGDNFYWTDWRTKKIESVNRSTRARGSIPVSSSGSKMFGMAVAPDGCLALANACQQRAACPPGHLCLLDGRGGRTCVCGTSEIGINVC